jgi:hypothetical protein
MLTTALRAALTIVCLGLGSLPGSSQAAPADVAEQGATLRSTAAASSNPFAGTRRLILAPVRSEGALGIDREWNAVYSEAFDRRSMFVLTEVGEGRYWIRTAELAPDGEPLCLRLGRGEVSATSCDASKAAQRFSFHAGGGTPAHPRYTIRAGGRHLVQRPSGSFTAKRTSAGDATPFVLLDRGRAQLPDPDRAAGAVSVS